MWADVYKAVQQAHSNPEHGGRDKMIKKIKKKYANITEEVLSLFKELCEESQLKKKKNSLKKYCSEASDVQRT